MFRVLSAGKISSCREGAQISGVQTFLLADVVIHSLEVLRSHGESCGGSTDSAPKVPSAVMDWKGRVTLVRPVSLLP